MEIKYIYIYIYIKIFRVQYLSKRTTENTEVSIYSSKERLKLWILKFKPMPEDNAADHIAHSIHKHFCRAEYRAFKEKRTAKSSSFLHLKCCKNSPCSGLLISHSLSWMYCTVYQIYTWHFCFVNLLYKLQELNPHVFFSKQWTT